MSGFEKIVSADDCIAAGAVRLQAPRWLGLLLALFVVVAQSLAQSEEQAADPFVAWLADGTKLTAASLPAWPLPGNDFQVSGVNLLDPRNPALLIRDRRVDLAPQPPLVFLANGDSVAGLPAELVVSNPADGGQRVQLQLQPPLMPVEGLGVTVRTDQIARILGPAGRFAQPTPAGTVLLADGSQCAVRSIRWRKYGLALLTESGVREVTFAELGDVVFPQVDAASAVVVDGLWAGTDPAALVMRFATAGGSVLTAAASARHVERLRSRERGSYLEVVHYIQPAWASHPLAVQERELAWIGYRRADQAPLSLLPAETLALRGLLSPPTPWLRNRSEGQPLLRGGQTEADLGIAARAHSELAFTLPTGAESFQTQVALDAASGAGGCVKCQIRAETAGGKLLWESGHIVGGAAPQSTGALPVAGLERLVLIADCAHAGRPAGADPLDIRDAVCWLRPLVTLSAKRWRATDTLGGVLSGLADWRTTAPEDAWRLDHLWNESADQWNPRLTLPQSARMTLVRKIKVDRRNDVVELRTACPQTLAEHQFELRVRGAPVACRHNEKPSRLIELRDRYYSARLARGAPFSDEDDEQIDDTLAYWWDLQAFRGQEVELELTLGGAAAENRLVWRGLALRGAVGNLPESGDLPKVDIPLTSVEPVDISQSRPRADPLVNLLPTGRGEPIAILGQQLSGGYGMRRNSFVRFALRPEWGSFVAVVGCCENRVGPFRVLLDDQVVWEKPRLTALEPGELIEIPLPAGAKSLQLEVGATGSYSSSAAWVEAGFVRRPAP